MSKQKSGAGCAVLLTSSIWQLFTKKSRWRNLPPVEHTQSGLKEHGLKWYRLSKGTSTTLLPPTATSASEAINSRRMKAHPSTNVSVDLELLRCCWEFFFFFIVLSVLKKLLLRAAIWRKKGPSLCRIWKRQNATALKNIWDRIEGAAVGRGRLCAMLRGKARRGGQHHWLGDNLIATILRPCHNGQNIH